MSKRNGTRKQLTASECSRAKVLVSMYGDVLACEMLGISQSTLWALKKRGYQPAKRAKRPMPSDFVLVAEGKNAEWLRNHYKAGNPTIARWRAEAAVAPAKGGPPSLERPADFVSVVQRLGTLKTAEHYGVHSHTVTKWKRQCGIRLRTDPKPNPKRIGWADTYFQQEAR